MPSADPYSFSSNNNAGSFQVELSSEATCMSESEADEPWDVRRANENSQRSSSRSFLRGQSLHRRIDATGAVVTTAYPSNGVGASPSSMEEEEGYDTQAFRQRLNQIQAKYKNVVVNRTTTGSTKRSISSERSWDAHEDSRAGGSPDNRQAGALKNSQGGGGGGGGLLPQDTITMFMMATLPSLSSSCFCRGDEDDHDDDDEEPEAGDEEHQGVRYVHKLNTSHSQTETLSDISKTERLSPIGKARCEDDRLCLPFWWSLLVFLVQLFTNVGIMISIFQYQSSIPNTNNNHNGWLRLIQIIAVFLAMLVQSTLVKGLLLMTHGPPPKKMTMSTTTRKFWMSVILRILLGTLGITTTFVWILYATSVMDVLVGLVVMQFVSTLDELAFRVASQGFLGVTLARKAMQVTAATSKNPYLGPSKPHCARLYCWYAGYSLILLTAFVTIWGLQVGRSLPSMQNQVYVQVDDTHNPQLFGISGVYQACPRKPTSALGNVVYVSIAYECRRFQDVLPPHSFAYCKDLQGWVLTPSDKEVDDPCQTGDHVLRSSKANHDHYSSSMDLLSHAPHHETSWVVERKSGGEYRIDESISIQSVDQFHNEFASCDTIESRGVGPGLIQEFQSLPRTSLETSYGLLYRPIYQRPSIQNGQVFQTIFFNGLRWMYIDLDLLAYAADVFAYSHNAIESPMDYLEDETSCFRMDNPNLEACWRVFTKTNQVYTSWLFDQSIVNVTAVSEPVLLLTKSDTGIPTSSLQWYQPQVFYHQEIIRPGTKLHLAPSFSNATGIGQNDFFFQCQSRVSPECTNKDHVGMSISVYTEAYPSYETLAFVFSGQAFQDLALVETVNVSPLNGGHFQLDDIRPNVVHQVGFVSGNNDDLGEGQQLYDVSTCVPSDDCVQIALLTRDDLHSDDNKVARLEIFYNDVLGVSTSYPSSTTTDKSCVLYQVGTCDSGDLAAPVDCNFDQVIQEYYPGNADPFDQF